MQRTTQCNRCGIVLNVPARAAGRRLKCPRCGERFSLGAGSAGSSFLLEPTNSDASGPSSHELVVSPDSDASAEALPVTAGEVRETFAVPLLDEVAARSGPRSAPGSMTRTAGPASKQVGDARALFDAPVSTP